MDRLFEILPCFGGISCSRKRTRSFGAAAVRAAQPQCEGRVLGVARERFFKLRRRDLHVLIHAEDVRELEPHRSHFELSGKLENVLWRRAVDVWRDGA